MRKVTIGTSSLPHPTFEPDETRPDSPEPLHQAAKKHVEEAARLGCDFLCLPELFANFNRSQRLEDTAETMDGPTASFLSRAAREHSLIIVTSVLLRSEGNLANTGVAYDKKGRLIGTYAKVHLPAGERDLCVPGQEFPVFETDGIRFGMQICYDLNFPEGCRSLALDGADIVFWPHMWGAMPENYIEVIMRARAMENLVWLVSSGYFLGGDGFFRVPKMNGRSCVAGWDGTILAEVGRRVGVAAATIAIDETRSSQSSRENMLHHHRMPMCYGRLTRQSE